MRPRGLIMDVSADPHGGIQTSEETTHENPIRVVDGILHYCVQNIPSLFARTAAEALCEITWPHLERIVRDGPEKAIKDSAMLRSGVVVWRGKVVGKRLGEAQGISTVEPDELLRCVETEWSEQ
jgi:alanine dehydrogenase